MTSALDNLGPHLLGRNPSAPDPRNYRLRDYLSDDEVAPFLDAPAWTDQIVSASDGYLVPLAASPTSADLRRALDAMHAHDRDPFPTWVRSYFVPWAQIVSALVVDLTPEPPSPPAPPAPPIPVPPGPAAAAVIWLNSESLDQGQTPHCCGFGGVTTMNTLGSENVDDHYTDADGDRLYDACKVIDGEPGAQDGSSVHSVAKALVQWGRISAYAWAGHIAEVKAWIVGHGPLVVGTDWTNDMFNPDGYGLVHPTGGVAGGHCWTVRGFVPAGQATPEGHTFDVDVFLAQNSWGPSWGVGGNFYISADDLNTLLFAANANGEALAAMELPLAA